MVSKFGVAFARKRCEKNPFTFKIGRSPTFIILWEFIGGKRGWNHISLFTKLNWSLTWRLKRHRSWSPHDITNCPIYITVTKKIIMIRACRGLLALFMVFENIHNFFIWWSSTHSQIFVDVHLRFFRLFNKTRVPFYTFNNNTFGWKTEKIARLPLPPSGLLIPVRNIHIYISSVELHLLLPD